MGNPNHDSKTGEFSSGEGGASSPSAAHNTGGTAQQEHAGIKAAIHEHVGGNKITMPSQMNKEELAHFNRPFAYKTNAPVKEARMNRYKQETLNADRSRAQSKFKT